MNTYGDRFRVTTYGESHGLAVGAIIDGCPAGVRIDEEAIRAALARRRGDGKGTTARREADEVRWLSGLREGVTLGTPIAFEVSNTDARSEDYTTYEHLCRPGHADYTTLLRYGMRDHRGGGRASGRETVARVVAGSVARQLMEEVRIEAHTTTELSLPEEQEESVGGVVECHVEGLRGGVGNPVFGRLNAALAGAMMSIPSAVGFEMGAGFAGAAMTGREWIDEWADTADGHTLTNHCGGIQGGISNGMPIVFRIAFHPAVTRHVVTPCLDAEKRQLATVLDTGRHDRCHVRRLPVVVESMTALCLINHLL